MTAIFPVDDEMTTIVCGTEPPADNWPPPWAARGIKKRLGHIYFSTLQYTSDYEAELAASVLKEKKNPLIGLVERAFIPITFYEYLVKHLPGATFVDATEWVDRLRVPKSPEEIELIKGTAALQDAVMVELKNIIKPGKRDLDVYAEIHCSAARKGSERAIVQVGSGPLGTIAPFDVPHFQNRVIREGDQGVNLIRSKRTRGVLHGASEGVDGGRGAASANEGCLRKDLLAKKGYFPPLRSFAHGQGQSLVDRPNLRPDETWKIEAGMNIAVHPQVVCKEALTLCGHNYIVGENGAERIHKCPREITVV
jgi:Xaa-Pro aminopeptidase